MLARCPGLNRRPLDKTLPYAMGTTEENREGATLEVEVVAPGEAGPEALARMEEIRGVTGTGATVAAQ